MIEQLMHCVPLLPMCEKQRYLKPLQKKSAVSREGKERERNREGEKGRGGTGVLKVGNETFFNKREATNKKSPRD